MLDPISNTYSAGALHGRRQGRVGVNRVKDGLTLGTLKSTSGPPAGAISRSSGIARTASSARSGRRSSSLYDLSSSGEGVLSRMRGQTRSASPLTGLSAGNESSAGGIGDLSRRRLSATNSLQAQMRTSFRRLDGRGRFLAAQANPQRAGTGFGVQILGHGFSQLG